MYKYFNQKKSFSVVAASSNNTLVKVQNRTNRYRYQPDLIIKKNYIYGTGTYVRKYN